MNGEPESTGSVTVLEFGLKQSPILKNRPTSISNSPTRRSRSRTVSMDIQTPLRRTTEPFTNVNDGSTLHSCRSCSSFEDDVDNMDETRRLLRIERQEADFSCDDPPKVERQTTEFSCYVPTRMNTIVGRNEPIQYYVPSRGPEKKSALFSRLILQDKDPKTAQYSGSPIKPVITSLGLKMKDVPSYVPTVVAQPSNQQGSEEADQRPIRPETNISDVSPMQTTLPKKRQDTEFSCDVPESENQETRPPKPSIRSASLPTIYQRRERKSTAFSCDPSLSSLSESQDDLQLRTRTERKKTGFSCNPSLSSPRKSQDDSQLQTRVDRKETEFSCDIPDCSLDLKPSQAKTRIKRQETDFSCVPDLSGSVRPSLSETKFLKTGTDFSCLPTRSLSEVSKGYPKIEESLGVDSLSVRQDTEVFYDLSSTIVQNPDSFETRQVSKDASRREDYLRVESQFLSKDSNSSFDFSSMIGQASESQEPEIGIEQDLGIMQPSTDSLIPKVSFKIPFNKLTIRSNPVPQILPKEPVKKTSEQSKATPGMKSIVEETTNLSNRIASSRKASEVIQNMLVSEISPKTLTAGTEGLLKQDISIGIQTRIPLKRDSSILRTISQKDKLENKSSNRLRKMSSDSALEETAKISSLISRNSRATHPSIRVIPSTSPWSVPASSPRISESKPEVVEQIKTPSLLSSSSKRSRIARHALLKGSVTTSNPVDLGLPIPPMLSQDIAAALGVGSGLESLVVKLKHTELKSPTGMPNVSSLPMYRKTDLVDIESEEGSISEQIVLQSDVKLGQPPTELNLYSTLEEEKPVKLTSSPIEPSLDPTLQEKKYDTFTSPSTNVNAGIELQEKKPSTLTSLTEVTINPGLQEEKSNKLELLIEEAAFGLALQIGKSEQFALLKSKPKSGLGLQEKTSAELASSVVLPQFIPALRDDRSEQSVLPATNPKSGLVGEEVPKEPASIGNVSKDDLALKERKFEKISLPPALPSPGLTSKEKESTQRLSLKKEEPVSSADLSDISSTSAIVANIPVNPFPSKGSDLETRVPLETTPTSNPLVKSEEISLSKLRPSIPNQRQEMVSKLSAESILVLTSVQLDELIDLTLPRTKKYVQSNEPVEDRLSHTEDKHLSLSNATPLKKDRTDTVSKIPLPQSTKERNKPQRAISFVRPDNATATGASVGIAATDMGPELRLVKSESEFSLSSRHNSDLLILEGLGLANPPLRNTASSRRSAPCRRSVDVSLSLQEGIAKVNEPDLWTDKIEKQSRVWQQGKNNFLSTITRKLWKDTGKSSAAPVAPDILSQLRSDATDAFETLAKVRSSSLNASDPVNDSDEVTGLVMKKMSWGLTDIDVAMPAGANRNDEPLPNQAFLEHAVEPFLIPLPETTGNSPLATRKVSLQIIQLEASPSQNTLDRFVNPCIIPLPKTTNNTLLVSRKASLQILQPADVPLPENSSITRVATTVEPSTIPLPITIDSTPLATRKASFQIPPTDVRLPESGDITRTATVVESFSTTPITDLDVTEAQAKPENILLPESLAITRVSTLNDNHTKAIGFPLLESASIACPTALNDTPVQAEPADMPILDSVSIKRVSIVSDTQAKRPAYIQLPDGVGIARAATLNDNQAKDNPADIPLPESISITRPSTLNDAQVENEFAGIPLLQSFDITHTSTIKNTKVQAEPAEALLPESVSTTRISTIKGTQAEPTKALLPESVSIRRTTSLDSTEVQAEPAILDLPTALDDSPDQTEIELVDLIATERKRGLCTSTTLKNQVTPKPLTIDDAEPPLNQFPESLPIFTGSTPQDQMGSEKQFEDQMVTSDTNLQYWGFVPAVVDEAQDILQNAVQGAFQDAVRKVAQNAMILKPEPNRPLTAYRELITDPLDEAAQTADKYLRQESEKETIMPPLYNDIHVPDQNFEEVVIGSKKLQKQFEEQCLQEDTPSARFLVQTALPDKSPPKQAIPNIGTAVCNTPDPRSYTPSQYSAKFSTQGSGSTIRVSGNNIALEDYERLVSPSRKSDSPLEATNETESALWKAWNTLSWSRKNGYAPVPIHRSSLESQTSKRKTSYALSPTHVSRSETAYRTLSLGSIKERPRETSSFDFEKEDEVAVDEASTNDSAAARIFPTITRRRTLQWLRDLLSNNEPYATRFTALPPRTQRDRFELQRAESAPVKPVEKLYLGATRRPAENISQPAEMQVFSKTVLDVEQLLTQALGLAKQAVQKNREEVIPVLENAVAALRDERPDLIDIPQSNSKLSDPRQSEFMSDIFEERLEVDSIHESNRSTYSDDRFSIGEESDAEDFEEIPYHNLLQSKDEAVVLEKPTVVVVVSDPPKKLSWAGWPPTGRAATPFPPSSFLESTFSNESGDLELVRVVDEESLEQKSAKSAEKARAINMVEATINKVEEPLNSLAGQESVYEARLSLPKHISQMEASSKEAKKLNVLIGHLGLSDQNKEKTETDIKVDSVVYIQETFKQVIPKPSRVPSGVEGRPKALPGRREVRSFIKEFKQPPIGPRNSSLKLREMAEAAARASSAYTIPARTKPIRTTNITVKPRKQMAKAVVSEEQSISIPTAPLIGQKSPVTSSQLSVDGPPPEEIDLGVPQQIDPKTEVSKEIRRHAARNTAEQSERPRQVARGEGHEGIPEEVAIEGHELRELPVGRNLPITRRNARNKKMEELNLRGKSHVSLKEHHKFSLGRSKKRQPIARDWSPGRKRFVAAVNCTSTALIGILIGIYAGQVPSIQYYLADFHHYAILGNVFLFIGLSIPTMFLWPLPLLHGRKPYILASMSIAMPLLFPQAVAVSAIRSPYVATYRVALLLPRAVMGFVLGLANMNFQATLLDLFGASLQSGNPHREEIDEFDVRRHGGGMGAWLPLWTWCYIGSIGVGFTIGAILINYIAPSVGMYICIIILLFISVLNVLTPEVRRGAYRRSVAEVKTEQGVSRRVARGEVKMHRVQTGPTWFGQELYHGMMLSRDMLKQPGFLVMAVYQAWIYGQVVLLIVLLGSLTSNSYKFKSPLVGASVAAIPIGAALAIPFESGGLFSRARTRKARSDSNTFDSTISLSSHIVRRAIFTLSLPIMGLGYTLTSYGQPVPWILPVLFSAAFGFLSNMTIAECVGIIMETWDTSDLQPGMTGRPRRNSGEDSGKRTNYSSFPRVAAAFGITQGLGFIFAACATAVGGVATRALGQQEATGVMAGILLVLTLLFFAVLIRWQDVQIVPNAKTGEMDLYLAQRRLTAMRPPDAPEVEEPWRPTIIGNPHSKSRRMSIIELGSLTRWTEIRRKNRLYDETVAHPDREILHQAHLRLQEERRQAVRSVHSSLRSAHGSLRGRLSREGSARGRRREPSDGDLGNAGDGWKDSMSD